MESHPNAPRVHATEFNDLIVTEGYTEKKKKKKNMSFLVACTYNGEMNAVVSSWRLFEIDSAFVDSFVLAEDRLQQQTDFVAVGFEMSPSVKHHLVVRPVLGIFHVLASSIHAVKERKENISLRITNQD